jgi:hypothetical protein
VRTKTLWADVLGGWFRTSASSSSVDKDCDGFLGDGGYDVMVSACCGFVRYCGISIVVIIVLIIATALFTMFAKIATTIICKFTGFPA